MGTIDLNLVRAFVAVHETGSFSGAAARLDAPRSTVSRAISALEASLRVRLFHRTTRQVSTTSAGVALYERLAPSLSALERSLAELPEREEEPSGILRVTSTVDLGGAVLAESVARFTSRYRAARVEVHLSNSVVNLVRDGFDLALRITRGKMMRESSLVVRRVGTIRIQLYASPSYLARRGTPRAPSDLGAHDWVSYRGAMHLQEMAAGEWQLTDSPPKTRITPEVRVLCDDMSFAREALKAGAGFGAIPSFLGDPEVVNGTLVRLLPQLVAETSRVYLVYPSQKHPAPKLTAFRDIVVELLRQRPLSAS
ncbi:LysR family transcriptional regulator [Pendulispora rubella]|uniref:LysR family transcriptional regulator n=1 Tax=Pendulispora rubella TaxID=2741070 RepID=A0ABZ2LJU2_9BACT